MYTDSMSYIQALQSNIDPSVPVVRKLLQACRKMCIRFAPPKHIHSHRKGTVYDSILDDVDSIAKQTAQSHNACVGWLSDLEPNKWSSRYQASKNTI